MKVKAKMKDGRVEVKLLAKHPMETGLAKDPDGNTIPAHYIEDLSAEVDGETVFVANLGPAVSKDPYLKFFYAGNAGDVVRLHWRDNTGAEETAEATVK